MNVNIDVSQTVLHTARLVLRPFSLQDLEDLYTYAQVEGVGEAAGWKHHESIEESQRILEMFISGRKTFAVEKDGRVIGSLGIEAYREDVFQELEMLKCREVGYVLAKEYWGQGLMSEAVREVLRWLFEDMKLDAVTCSHFTGNDRSRRVIEKCGFSYVRDFEYTTVLGNTEKTRGYVLYKKDWKK